MKHQAQHVCTVDSSEEQAEHGVLFRSYTTSTGISKRLPIAWGLLRSLDSKGVYCQGVPHIQSPYHSIHSVPAKVDADHFATYYWHFLIKPGAPPHPPPKKKTEGQTESNACFCPPVNICEIFFAKGTASDQSF